MLRCWADKITHCTDASDRERADEIMSETEEETRPAASEGKRRAARDLPAPILDLGARPTRESIILAYQLILGRPPWHERLIDQGLEISSIELLRDYLLSSRHFNRIQKQARARPFLFFIHIPKTAGGSMRRYFRTVFGDACRWLAKNPLAEEGSVMRRNVDFDADGYLEKYRLGGGHIPFDHISKALLARDPIFISMLRHPVKRVVSAYNFARTERQEPPVKSGAKALPDLRNLTLYEALTGHKRFRMVCERQQLRYLCGSGEIGGVESVLNSHRFMLGKLEHLDDFMQLLHDQLDLPLVRGNVRHVHKAAPDYLAAIAAQPRYEEAIDIITKMNADEFTLFNSFGKTWTNVGENYALSADNPIRMAAAGASA